MHLRIMLSLFLVTIFHLSKVIHTAVEFGTPPSNVTGLLGNNATFSCELSGTQTPGSDMQFYMTEPNQQLIGYNSNVKNETKYSVSGVYNYTIHDVSLSDGGRYECILFPNSLAAYLTVAVPPTSLSLEWNTERHIPVVGTLVNLTCSSRWSRPSARIKWYKNEEDITKHSFDATTTYSESGFGDTISIQELLLTNEDSNSTFKCVINLADIENVTSTELNVNFLLSSTSRGNTLLVCRTIWMLIIALLYISSI